MDSITQAALGAVVGEAVLGKRLGWRAAAWGAFFGTLPDLDILAAPFLDQAEQMRWHRGISHSLFLIALCPLLFVKPLAWLHRKRALSARHAGLFVFLVWSTHVLIDVYTTYGTQIWEPFSNARVSTGNLFIIDFFFTIPLLLSLLLLPFYAPGTRARRAINATAIALCCFYSLASFGMKAWATHELKASIARDAPGSHLIATSPTFSNILLWRALAATGGDDGEYLVRYWSPFDRETAALKRFPKQRALAHDFRGDELFETLTWFSRGHWIARQTPDENGLLFIDMRYPGYGNPTTNKLEPTFAWRLERHPDGSITMENTRPRNLDIKALLHLMLLRLRGELAPWERYEAF